MKVFRNTKKKQIETKHMLLILSITCVVGIFAGLIFNIKGGPLNTIAGYIFVPMQQGINNTGAWIFDFANDFRTLSDVLEENKELKAKIEELEKQISDNKQDQYELENLRELFELDEKYPDYEKVAASVIAKNSGNWFSTFTINRGSKDGIEVDMNVIAGNGLVGIVYQVSDNYSLVRSIIDDESKVSSMLINTSDICAVSGDLKLMDNGYIKLGYLDAGVRIKDGDMIVTSSISNKFLAGILIGYAKDITLDSNNLTQSGYLIPAVDFKHIQKVLVITEKKITSDSQK